MIQQLDPICALTTPPGIGAIGIIRVSGLGAIDKVNGMFFGKNLTNVEGHTIHHGEIRDQNIVVDEVLVSVFKSPRSYTREDVAEISCHGSDYILQQVMKLLIKAGCRTAEPGEFTQRAFLNGQLDLSQAEAVADLIAADSAASHQVAMAQMRGGFSKKLAVLNEQLVHFASLVELELDFGEEDVEFAQRDDLKNLILELQREILPMIDAFDADNVIKAGIPVAIIGPPNAGKSTLLNALLNEEKAIVTHIAGTTRDIIEDQVVLGGRKFRFIDTAGIRETADLVESMGIERSKQALANAQMVIFLFTNLAEQQELRRHFEDQTNQKKVLWVQNKIDLEKQQKADLHLSAKDGKGIEDLKTALLGQASQMRLSDLSLTNGRHYEHLLKTQEALDATLYGLENGITGDFLAQDIRLALHHLGLLTGQITNDDLLANIFGKFCIGK